MGMWWPRRPSFLAADTRSLQISCYVIVPSPELSPAAAATELAEATQRLAREVNGLVRKTEFGILLVSSPAGYGQEL